MECLPELVTDGKGEGGLMYVKILKANPHHDEKGRFSTADAARFTSIEGVFARPNDLSRISLDLKP